MSSYTFRMPDIGEGVAEAEVVEWLVAPGDQIEEGAVLAAVMTDKATVELESPVAGIVQEIAGEAGAKVAIGAPLVVLKVSDDDTAVVAVCFQHEMASTILGNGEEGRSAPAVQWADLASPSPPSETAGTAARTNHGRAMAAPAVRARAAKLGIDLAQLRPAEGVRIRHSDIDAFIAYTNQGGFRAAGARWPDEVVKVIGLRRRIAENMAASKRSIPHFAYVERYDVTALEAMRAQLNAERGAKPKLTILPFLIAGICRSLAKFPMLNARFDDERGEVTRHGAVHLGVATHTPAGLMVPVIRDAQDLNLWQLAGEIARLAQAARDGSARSSELSGSTITLSSLGPMGGVATAPVINRPEVAIIGPNRIEEAPAFIRDASGFERVEKRKLMNISMSCDHRVVDGWHAASFAQDLKKLVEAPALILAGPAW